MPGYGYGDGYGAPMMHEGGHGEYGMGIAGSLLMIVIAVAVIAVLLRHLKHMRKGGGMGWHCNSALHTLEERYAKGEINTQEFEERRKVLRS